LWGSTTRQRSITNLIFWGEHKKHLKHDDQKILEKKTTSGQLQVPGFLLCQKKKSTKKKKKKKSHHIQIGNCTTPVAVLD
jgi:hypothetical protein